MVKPNRRRTTKRPRRPRGQKRMRRQLPTSALRNNSTVSLRAPAMREFCMFAKQITASVSNYGDVDKSKDIWLDSLLTIGLIALKVFITIFTSTKQILTTSADRKFIATGSYITSAVQSILIGAEDLLYSSPIMETENHTAGGQDYAVPCIDFQQVRMSACVIKVSSGSAHSSRAGRFVACLIDLTEEELGYYVDFSVDTKADVNKRDSWSFQEVAHMPGAVTAPFGVPITLHWRARPTSYANRFLSLGQANIEGATFTKNLRGGKPNFRLIIGYQDFASTTGSATSLYAPDEAILNVDVRGQVVLREKGRRYIRFTPIVTMDSAVATATDAQTRVKTECKLSQFAIDHEGCIHHMSGVEDFEMM